MPAVPSYARILPDEAGRLSALARRLYLEHYAALWRDGGAAYAGRAFAAAALAAELARPAEAWSWIGEGDATVGFLKWVEPRAAGARGLYLERLYLSAARTGAGLGSAALAFVERAARAGGHGRVWLRAMADEPRVLRFYGRAGYVVEGADHLAAPGIAPGRGAMVVLARELGPDDARSAQQPP